MEIEFHRAYYIKLGRAGIWETDSITNSRVRFGWSGQSVEDINSRAWDRIEAQLRSERKGKPQVATRT